MQTIAFLIIGSFVLYLVVALAVKTAIKESYYELKEDLIKELKLSFQTNSNEDKQ